MSKVIQTTSGKAYAVTTQSGCNVYADEAGTQLIKAVEAGQGYFVAIGSRTWVDDDTAIVTETFNGAARKLRLLAGGVKDTLPAGYTRLEYLESATMKQWIDSNAVNNKYTRIKIKFSVISSKLKSDSKIIGAGHVALCIYGGFWREGSLSSGVQIVADNIYDAELWTDGNNWNEYNCGKIYNTATQDLYETSTLYNASPDSTVMPTLIFSIYAWGGIEGSVGIRIYSVNIKNDSVSRKFIPALDPTGAPCMYDLVSKTPYYNAGSGEFLYPAVGASTWGLRRPVAEWGKLTPHGVRRLYKLPDSYTGEPEQYIAENGFKRLVENDMPAEGYWEPEWRETDTELVLDWREVEPPSESENTPEILTDTTQQ